MYRKSPLGEILGVDMFVEGAHITAMNIKSLPHGGIEKGLKHLKGGIKDPVLIDNMQGGSANRHGSLQRDNS